MSDGDVTRERLEHARDRIADWLTHCRCWLQYLAGIQTTLVTLRQWERQARWFPSPCETRPNYLGRAIRSVRCHRQYLLAIEDQLNACLRAAEEELAAYLEL